eukprot:GSMAST32.ASY1.ANO1.1386.1 assembled CDS
MSNKSGWTNEQKELERVFTRLCNFAEKERKHVELKPKLQWLEKIQSYRKRPNVLKIHDDNGKEMSDADLDSKYDQLQYEVATIKSGIEKIIASSDAKVKVSDINEALKTLGVTKKRQEIEEMIWEVDENLDGCVDWEEFQLMFERNMSDTTGLEPFQLFNVVQFMMYDKDNSGAVSIDETMTMLYQRYGKDRLESELQKLFGKDLKTNDGDGELSFSEYLRVVEKRIPEKKKKVSPKGKRR